MKYFKYLFFILLIGSVVFGGAITIKQIDQINTSNGSLSVSSSKITNVVDPTSNQDAATKNYVDTQLLQLNPAAAVFAASTANISGTYVNAVSGICIGDTFTTTSTSIFTVDGQTPTTSTGSNRVLFKNQTSSFQNGVWVLTTAAVPGISGAVFTRALDSDSSDDFNSGQIVPIANGTVNAGSSYYQTSANTTCNTSTQTWTLFQNAASSYLSSTLTSSNIYVGNGSNVATSVSLSGDATLSNTGALTLGTVSPSKGGTGVVNPTANGVLIGEGSSAVNSVTGSTAGNVLTWNASGDPSFQAPTGGTNVVAIYKSTAGNSISNSTITYIDFPTKVVDSNNAVTGAGGGNSTTAGSGWLFTAPVSGTYQVSTVVLISNFPTSTNLFDETWISQNNVAVWNIETNMNTSVQWEGAPAISGAVHLALNDTIQIAKFQTSGGSRTISSNAFSCVVSIVRTGNF